MPIRPAPYASFSSSPSPAEQTSAQRRRRQPRPTTRPMLDAKSTQPEERPLCFLAATLNEPSFRGTLDHPGVAPEAVVTGFSVINLNPQTRLAKTFSPMSGVMNHIAPLTHSQHRPRPQHEQGEPATAHPLS